MGCVSTVDQAPVSDQPPTSTLFTGPVVTELQQQVSTDGHYGQTYRLYHAGGYESQAVHITFDVGPIQPGHELITRLTTDLNNTDPAAPPLLTSLAADPVRGEKSSTASAFPLCLRVHCLSLPKAVRRPQTVRQRDGRGLRRRSVVVQKFPVRQLQVLIVNALQYWSSLVFLVLYFLLLGRLVFSVLLVVVVMVAWAWALALAFVGVAVAVAVFAALAVLAVLAVLVAVAVLGLPSLCDPCEEAVG